MIKYLTTNLIIQKSRPFSGWAKTRYLIICLFIGNPVALAQNQPPSCIPVALSPGLDHFSLTPLVYYLEDPGGRLTFEDVCTPEVSSRFTYTEKTKSNFGFTHSAYWVRFCIKNPQPAINDWLLEIEYVHFDSILFFNQRGDRVIRKHLGDMQPFRQRELYTRTFIIPLDHPDTLTQNYYIRFRTEGSMQLSMNIYRQKFFFKKATLSETYYGIYFGIMFALFIYNLIVYFALRDISYLHGVILIFANTIFQAAINGQLFQYILPNSMHLSNSLIPMSITFSEFCMILFARSFLNIRKYSVALSRVTAFFLLFALISMFSVFYTSYNISSRIATHSSLLYIFMCLLSGVICLMRGNRAARIYILAFTLFLMGAVGMSLMTIGLLPRNILTAHGMEIGSMLNWIFLSMALTDNYKISVQEKDRAREEISLVRQKATESLERKVKERTLEIEEKNETLKQQKEELETTLDYLKKTQVQLIESEKMAALGGLVAGVAHEINTPVGIGVTAVSNLQEEIQKMEVLYKNDKVSRKGFKEFLDASKESAILIQKHLERTAELIQSFKQVSADQLSEQQRVFNLRCYLDDIIRSLHPKFRDKEITIIIECDDRLDINSFPGAYAQVFTNLILNSVTHGFSGRKKGTVTIRALQKDGLLAISYIDDGNGISSKDLPHIFEPFYTSDNHQGTGLGLHIVYNIIKQKLLGSISCSSEPGKGVLFQIDIPEK
jgi:signal transduction histidine kinase